jgi:6-phosphogluconate dehydrogenase
MQIGIVGLGKMGFNMALRLKKGRHQVVGYNRSSGKVDELKKRGCKGAYAIEELVDALKPPRTIWLMLPAGGPTEDMIERFKGLLKRGDTIVEGGNSYFKEDMRHAEELRPLGIRYVDAGVSGGIWGLKIGYCLMVGGEKRDFNRLRPIFKTLAPKDGFLHCGPTGAGHFVKMVHNGIEYGMMSAYGEGFNVLDASPYGQQLDYAKLAHLWNQGSVIRSWLLELAEDAFRKDPELSNIEGYVTDSGEGRWTVQQAVELGVPAPVMSAALFQRFSSRNNGDCSNRLLAALRNEFGGHSVVRSKSAKKGK